MSTAPAAPTGSSPIPSAAGAGSTPSDGTEPGALPGWIWTAQLVNLIAQIGIFVTGGLVRVSGSGLGCPTWPQCVKGSFTPTSVQAQGWHKYVEFGNRTLTSVLTVTAIVALASAIAYRRRTGAGRRVVVLGTLPIVLVLVQAVIGGISVLVKLSPISVAAHFLGSIALVVVSTLLLVAVSRRQVPAHSRREVRWIAAAVAAVGTVVIVLGTMVTGSGPHSGDATQPARFGFNPRDVSWLHADAVCLFVGLVVALLLVVRLTGGADWLRRRSLELVGITLLQGLIGYVQYFTHLPSALVVVHMLGAAVLTVGITAVCAGVLGNRALTGR
jgi:cytochrome c oxidase assembly protein subunit 15